MKKKILKITALTLAILLIVGVLMFANSLVGNPISKALAKNTAEKHIAEAYSGTDYTLEELNYSFKDGYYHALVTSESSIDTKFTLLINGFGKLRYDNFEYNVTNCWSTANRLDNDYRSVVDALFESKSFPYNEHMGYGELVFVPTEQKDDPYVPDYAIITSELTLDSYYNVNDLGARAGKLTVYLDDETVSAERMAEILLGIRSCFDKAGVGFYAIDCILEYPQNDTDSYRYGQIEVIEFRYSDIYEEGLVERVSAADNAAKEYYGLNSKDSLE